MEKEGLKWSAITIIVSCDLRIAADNTWLWSPDPRYRGLLAEGGVEIMRQRVGASRAAMLNLTNERINAITANEWGLFYRLVSKDKLKNNTLELAEKISKYAFDSLKLTKKMLNKTLNHKFDGAMLKDFLKS